MIGGWGGDCGAGFDVEFGVKMDDLHCFEGW